MIYSYVPLVSVLSNRWRIDQWMPQLHKLLTISANRLTPRLLSQAPPTRTSNEILRPGFCMNFDNLFRNFWGFVEMNLVPQFGLLKKIIIRVLNNLYLCGWLRDFLRFEFCWVNLIPKSWPIDVSDWLEDIIVGGASVIVEVTVIGWI